MTAKPSRLIGRITGEEPGPTLIVVAGLHGNEPAGIEAAHRVLSALRGREAGLRGDLALLAGNLQALAAGRRFLVRDMNRGWDAGRLSAVDRTRASGEDKEQIELEDRIAEIAAGSRGPLYFIDLHTTSAEGVPFSMIRDTPEQIAFASLFGLPVIIGLLEKIDGVLLEHMRRKGFTCLGVEGGKNDSAASVDHHEAVLRVALQVIGMATADLLPDFDRYQDRLLEARGDLPAVTRVVHRHAIHPGDEFRMEPGFRNIQAIRTGQLLARDRNGEIRAREAGLLLMPLYQAQGDDGFFLGRRDLSPDGDPSSPGQ